jgi:hypothetical protein
LPKRGLRSIQVPCTAELAYDPSIQASQQDDKALIRMIA